MRDGVDIKRLIQRAASQFAERPALITPEQTWTFREINERACRLANALLARGVEPNTSVATIRWNRPEHVEIALALLKIGAAMINVNPRLSPEDMRWQIEDSESTIVLAAAEFRDSLEQIRSDLSHLRGVLIFGGDRGPFTDYEEELRRASPSEPVVPGYSMANVGYIRYTSGTTGKPKGVVHDQHTLLAVTRNLLLDYTPDLGPDSVMLALQGIYHGAGWFALPCWLRGVPLAMIKDFSDPEAGVAAIKRFGATHIKTVPTILTRILAVPTIADEWRATRAHTVVYGGSPMSIRALGEGIEKIGSVFVQLYGQAESPMTISVMRKDEHTPKHLSSAGRPITLADVRVVDDDDNPVPVGEPGEVVVQGDHNMRGYWKQPPELTATVVRNGFVHTGDIGVFDGDGFLYLVDRKNEMIVSGGLNVYPNEVEQVLYEHPAVLEAAVVGAPDDEWGETVAAVVVLHRDASLEERELIDFAAQRLAKFKRPRRVIFADALPKNAAGKIMRKVVREPLWAGRTRRIN
jgi:acyl-CoA synthetase (AMP-forming)/AMP-acid ligase II